MHPKHLRCRAMGVKQAELGGRWVAVPETGSSPDLAVPSNPIPTTALLLALRSHRPNPPPKPRLRIPPILPVPGASPALRHPPRFHPTPHKQRRTTGVHPRHPHSIPTRPWRRRRTRLVRHTPTGPHPRSLFRNPKHRLHRKERHLPTRRVPHKRTHPDPGRRPSTPDSPTPIPEPPCGISHLWWVDRTRHDPPTRTSRSHSHPQRTVPPPHPRHPRPVDYQERTPEVIRR